MLARGGAVAVVALLVALSLRPAAAGEPPPREYDVKAVFIHHFTRYLRWPPDAAGGSFEIAVFGESEIVAPLREIAKRKTVDDHPIVVRQVFAAEEIGQPRILFVPRGTAFPFEELLRAVRGGTTVIVAEKEGFGRRGAAINFVLRDESIRFEVSERALRGARVSAGAQLLKLAIRVDDDLRGEP